MKVDTLNSQPRCTCVNSKWVLLGRGEGGRRGGGGLAAHHALRNSCLSEAAKASTKKITKWQPTVPTLWLLWQPTVTTLWLLWQSKVTSPFGYYPLVTMTTQSDFPLWLLSSGYYDNPKWLPPMVTFLWVTMNNTQWLSLWLLWQPTVTTPPWLPYGYSDNPQWLSYGCYPMVIFYWAAPFFPRYPWGESVLLPCDSRTLKDSLNDLGFFNSCDWMSYIYRATRPVIPTIFVFFFFLFFFCFLSLSLPHSGRHIPRCNLQRFRSLVIYLFI